MNTLSYEERGDFSQISSQFQFIKEELNQDTIIELSTKEYSILSSFSSESYLNRELFEKALLEHVGSDVFEKIKIPVVEIADQGRKRYFEKYSWLFSYKKDLISYSQVINLTKTAAKQIKTEGIHQHSKKVFEAKTKNLLLTSSLAKKIKKDLIFHLDEEGNQIPVGEALLGTSDVIESIIGKYKSFTLRSPVKELGKLLLTIPVFTTKIRTNLIKKAMEKVQNLTVEKYSEETFGISTLSKRKMAFNGKSEQKVREKIKDTNISDVSQTKEKPPIKSDKFHTFYSFGKSKKVENNEKYIIKSAS